MRLLAGLLLMLGSLAPRPTAAADYILYATAATPGRIDGFCLGANGALAPTPIVSIQLATPNPRRILLDSGVLYVAEPDRVEAFMVGADGKLTLLEPTEVLADKMDARDLRVAQSTDGTRVLYVSQRGPGHVAGYRLGTLPPDVGRPMLEKPIDDKPQPFTCLQDSNLRDLFVSSNNQLFVASSGFFGKIDVFDIDPQGKMLDAATGQPTVCPPGQFNADNDATPVKQRRKLEDPKGFAVVGDLLYVQELQRHKIRVFSVSDFPPPKPTSTTTTTVTVTVTTTTSTSTTLAPPISKTAGGLQQYTGFFLNILNPLTPDATPSAVIVTQFSRGRIDSFLLGNANPDKPKRCDPTVCPAGSAPCCLPKQPTVSTEADVRMSPVGLTVAEIGTTQVLYVAGGDLDRVRAYHLGRRSLPDHTHFSQTDQQQNSFPNDVAVTMLSDKCP